MTPQTSAAPVRSRFETRPLTAHFGVEVFGFKFKDRADPDEMAVIQEMADRHLVLLFRDQKVSETAHVAFGEAMGTVIAPVEPKFTSPTNAKILHLGNVNPVTGEKLGIDDPATKFTYAPEKWHSDGSYKPIPNYLTILHALEIPPEGGETWFASMVAAYAALPRELRELIDGRTMQHPYPYSGLKVKDWTGNQLTYSVHPMVRVLPDGQKALYISPFGGCIEGMGEEESNALIAKLLSFATSGAFSYHHQWRLGDTLLWNNRGLVHQAQPWDRVKHRRMLQRVELGYVNS